MKSKTMKIGALMLMSALAVVNYSHAQKGKKSNEKEILYQDFETVKDKETVAELGGIELIEGLSSPTEVKADIFMAAATGDVGIPINVYGKEEPVPGEGGKVYAGFVAYKPGKMAAERSYITIPIKKGSEQITLKKGLTYCIEFSVSLSESSKFAVNNIAACFSKEAMGSGAPGAIYNSSEKLVRGQKNNIYTGFFGWEKVCNTYVAKGDEKFITIGNFDRNEATKFEQTKKPKDSDAEILQHAYYYVDNIIIRQVDNVTECKCFNSAPPKPEDSFSTLVYTCTPEESDKMSKEEILQSHMVYFRAGKTGFSDNAKEMMNYIINEMKADPKMKIEITGHNDTKEDKAGEQNPEYEDMAHKRVSAVVKYFVASGIDETRLTKVYKGAAERNPGIAEDDEEEVQDAKNRYVSFKVVK